MGLQNLQVEFAEAIFSESKPTGIDPAANFCIYQNNCVTTLIKVLKELYPMIVKIVGEDFFQCTAKEYIKLYPSRTPTLHTYGEYFPHFLSHYQPLKDLVYLFEVAKFEWACHEVYYSKRTEKLDKSVIEKIPIEKYDQLQFGLNPACQIIKFYFPILRIIDLCEKNIDELVNLEEGGVNLLIIRRDLEISLVPLVEADFIFLHNLNIGKTLGETVKEVMIKDAHFDLKNKLRHWVEDKTIVACSLYE